MSEPNKINLRVMGAIDTLRGPVFEAYSQAVADGWAVTRRRREADQAMSQAARPAMRTLRRYIRRRLKLEALESVEFHGPGYCVDHSQKPETCSPWVSLRVFVGDGIQISGTLCPTSQTQLDAWLDRLRDAVAAARSKRGDRDAAA